MFVLFDLPLIISKKKIPTELPSLIFYHSETQQIVPIATKMNRRWICNDVWMDILPSFDHAQLGLKMALLSPRFDALVDKHFDGQSEFPILRTIKICKDPVAAVPKLAVIIDKDNSMPFPLPDHLLPNKIRFKDLWITYIDHFVIAFLRANQQIFHKWDDTNLTLVFYFPHSFDDQPIWDVLARELWPFFASNIRHFHFPNGDHLDNLRRRTSPTILADLNINSIFSRALFPDSICDDGPNATAGQALSKWLHTPRKDGQPKQLGCMFATAVDVNNFKEKFLNDTTSVSYKIQFSAHPKSMPIEPFELVNGRTNEKLILIKPSEDEWDRRLIMNRRQNGETAVQWEYEINLSNLNNVHIGLYDVNICLGPFSPPEQQQ